MVAEIITVHPPIFQDSSLLDFLKTWEFAVYRLLKNSGSCGSAGQPETHKTQKSSKTGNIVIFE